MIISKAVNELPGEKLSAISLVTCHPIYRKFREETYRWVFFLQNQGRESEFVHANLFTSENKNINNILVFANIFQNEQDHYAFSNEIQVTIVPQLCKMLLLSKG